MKQLIGFEIRKMLRKPLVWAVLIGLIGFMALMEYNWVVPGYAVVQTDENGQRVYLEDFAGMAANKEIASLFYGPLTDEKVRQIIETYDMTDSFWEANSLDPSREAHYSHNLIYDTLSINGFVNLDGSYSGQTVEDAFGALASDLILGYSTGWECTIYTLIYTLLLWGCIIVVMIAPVFSEEYTIHTDALILTGIHGRKKCTLAKIISSFLLSVGGTVLLVAVCTLLFLAVHGSTGWDTSVQLGELRIFWRTPYTLNWLQAYGLACVAWLGAIIVLTAVVLVVSALAKSAFSAVVIAFVIYAVPMFLPWNLLPESIEFLGYLLPINQIQLMKLFQQKMLTMGSLAFPPVFLALPITIIALIAGVLWSKKKFSGHQVM